MKSRKFEIGVIIAALLLGIATTCAMCGEEKPTEAESTSAAEPTRIVSPLATEAVTEATEAATEAETVAEYVSLGEYKLTAYCACEACCGAWATDRPTDKDGNPVIYTASMAEAKQGVTVAADTSVHPFGTVLMIDGNEYTVQDRGGAVKGKHIDIFFDSHEEAAAFGLQYGEVFVKGGQG